MRGEARTRDHYRALKSPHTGTNLGSWSQPQSRRESHNSIRSSQTRIDSCSEPMSRPGQPSPHKRILQAITRLAHVPAVFLPAAHKPFSSCKTSGQSGICYPDTHVSLANLSVQIPTDQFLHHRPFQTCFPDAFPVDVEGDPQDQDRTAYASHGSESTAVAVLCNPRIRIKGEQEAESS